MLVQHPVFFQIHPQRHLLYSICDKTGFTYVGENLRRDIHLNKITKAVWRLGKNITAAKKLLTKNIRTNLNSFGY